MAEKNKLTPETIEKICARKRADPAITKVALAAEFNLNRATIEKALAGMESAPGIETSEAATGLAMLTYASIARSPLNPRKTFDEAELAELADSIAVNGLLQNLVVRPSDDGFILMAGERRLRAIGLLVESGRWDGPIPCLVIDADEATHLALALLENLHRQDVPTLEEAAAFAQLQALDPETYTTHAIATRIGRTERYVYQRLALAKNLSEDAKVLFTAGKLNVEGARLLAAQPLEIQEKVISEQWRNWRDSEHDSDVQDLVIEDDDEPLSVNDIKGELRWLESQALAAKCREEIETARANGTPLPDDPEEEEDETETPEEAAEREAREAAIAKRQEETKAFHEARAAEKAAELARFHSITKRLESDFPPLGEDEEMPAGQRCCNTGCKWRVLLNWGAPSDFHVCTNPMSPRAGLLTEGEQGGNGCFEVA